MRICIATIAWAGSGGPLRPSRRWQEEQERALKRGPRPSRPEVEAGATTQFSLKKEWPTKKAARWSSFRLGAGKPKAFGEVSKTVVSPPENSSPDSGSEHCAGNSEAASQMAIPTRLKPRMNTNEHEFLAKAKKRQRTARTPK